MVRQQKGCHEAVALALDRVRQTVRSELARRKTKGARLIANAAENREAEKKLEAEALALGGCLRPATYKVGAPKVVPTHIRPAALIAPVAVEAKEQLLVDTLGAKAFVQQMLMRDEAKRGVPNASPSNFVSDDAPARIKPFVEAILKDVRQNITSMQERDKATEARAKSMKNAAVSRDKALKRKRLAREEQAELAKDKQVLRVTKLLRVKPPPLADIVVVKDEEDKEVWRLQVSAKGLFSQQMWARQVRAPVPPTPIELAPYMPRETEVLRIVGLPRNAKGGYASEPGWLQGRKAGGLHGT